jgi:hypothetical protein
MTEKIKILFIIFVVLFVSLDNDIKKEFEKTKNVKQKSKNN